MFRNPQESVSIWQGFHGDKPEAITLSEDIQADACVIGAGISGLTTAYLLQKSGLSVVVLDAWDIGAGETGRTTAHLTAVLDDRFFRLEKLFDEERSKLAADSHRAAIDRIESIAKEENIDCDFERIDGYLIALDEQQCKEFEKEKEAVKRAGFSDSEVLDRVPLDFIQATGPVIRFPQQAAFNIAKYVYGLANAFQSLGGQIYARSPVTEIKGGDEAHAKTENGKTVYAKHMVVATNTPVNDWVKIHTKQYPYRSYVVGFEIEKGRYPNFLFWDMADPYHYVRLVRGPSSDTLIAGGEDHKTGQADDMDERYRKLEEWARRHFAGLGPVNYRWSGQVMEPMDGMAFIGRNPMDADNVYIATGDSGNGMTHGTIAGMLISDLIRGRKNPWEDLYNPARKNIKSIKEFVKENANFVGALVKDWVAPSEVDKVDDIEPGQGAILRDGMSKIAVYKDEQGAVYKRSAICTHMGCVVQWNQGEKSWDCPCHGSRFDCEGRVLNGPAAAPLGQAD